MALRAQKGLHQRTHFTRLDLDHLIFYHKALNEYTVVTVATDDMIVTSKHLKHIEKLKEGLK